MGVFKENGKYRARFYRNGKSINVGTFKTKHEAQAALEEARGSTEPVNVKYDKGLPMADFGTPIVKHKSELSLWQKIRARFKK